MEPIEIEKLPNEVLELILRHMSTSDLLHYREVSAQWNGIATYVCRKRRVRITADKFYYSNPDPTFICHIFPDKANIPWSSIHINLSFDYRSPGFNRQIFATFGKNINQLIISINTYDYQNYIYILRNTPNLQVLQLTTTLTSFIQPSQLIYALSHQRTRHIRHKNIWKKPSAGVISLPRLNSLGFSLNNYHSHSLHIDLLKFVLCSCSAAIQSVSLHVEHLYSDDKLEQILVLFENIEKVKLSLRYDSKTSDIWSLLAVRLQERPLNLQKLHLIVYQSSRNKPPSYYEPLINCLNNCRKLIKLKIIIHTSTAVPPSSNSCFCLPMLPTLQALKLCVEMDGASGVIQESVSNIWGGIVPLDVVTPVQVPNLKIFKISCNNQLWRHSVRFDQVFEDRRFESVTTLLGNVALIKDNWSFIFPNLVNLTLIVQDSKSLEDIFECLKNLNVKYLYLNFNVEMDIDATVKTCFTEPELKDLKTLGINEYGTDEKGDGKRLSDEGAILLLLLPPLHLKICAKHLSGECISKLKDHHKTVEEIRNGYAKWDK